MPRRKTFFQCLNELGEKVIVVIGLIIVAILILIALIFCSLKMIIDLRYLSDDVDECRSTVLSNPHSEPFNVDCDSGFIYWGDGTVSRGDIRINEPIQINGGKSEPKKQWWPKI